MPESDPLQPIFRDELTTLFQADALAALAAMPTGSVDAIVSDPPYSSGGLTRSDRTVSTNAKYSLTGVAKEYPDFLGDNKDQRAYALWSALWFAECFRIVRPGGLLLVFTDWRQLPTVSDAIQCGGWVWRGIVPWDKTEAVRPQKVFFRAQCEYILTGTKRRPFWRALLAWLFGHTDAASARCEYILTASAGGLGMEQERPKDAPCLPGFFRQAVLSQQKKHLTGKPFPLMQEILRVLPPGSTVLDPFAGSGTTLLAARSLNLRSIGVEQSPAYAQMILEELQAVTLQQLSPA